MKEAPSLREKLTGMVKSLIDESEEVARIIVETLLSGKARIRYDEIASLARKIGGAKRAKGLSQEAVMAMGYWRLMLPARTSHGRGIAWENRLSVPRAGEIYEVPRCVSYTFGNLVSKGTWDWEFGVKEYMREIGEKDENIVLEVIKRLVKGSYFKRLINARMIEEACRIYNYPRSTGTLIAELKGGGVMSPCLSHSLVPSRSVERRELFSGGPLYELNRALFLRTSSLIFYTEAASRSKVAG